MVKNHSFIEWPLVGKDKHWIGCVANRKDHINIFYTYLVSIRWYNLALPSHILLKLSTLISQLNENSMLFTLLHIYLFIGCSLINQVINIDVLTWHGKFIPITLNACLLGSIHKLLDINHRKLMISTFWLGMASIQSISWIESIKPSTWLKWFTSKSFIEMHSTF